MQAISYGNVYVATVAMGANPQQTLDAFREAEAYDGPSLILAYSHCIAHGIDMRQGMKQQALAVASGHWPLMRFDPGLRRAGLNPFQLDSPRPTVPLKEYQATELRYKSLVDSRPQEAAELSAMAQVVATERYRKYEELARTDGSRFHPATDRSAKRASNSTIRHMSRPMLWAVLPASPRAVRPPMEHPSYNIPTRNRAIGPPSSSTGPGSLGRSHNDHERAKRVFEKFSSVLKDR